MRFTEEELNRNVISSSAIEGVKIMNLEELRKLRERRIPSKRKKKERKKYGRTK